MILAANKVNEGIVDVGPTRQEETAARTQLVEEEELLALKEKSKF